ncbi:hypothetical protein [Hymenobacter koreensis]|uniref:Uncharacterized protein n=1 Tax=Hymenobacter koreensis TaxID=1084523 RepID=A0ABP8JMS0_9BACT
MMDAETLLRLATLLNNRALVTQEECEKMMAALAGFDNARAEQAMAKIEAAPRTQAQYKELTDLLNHPLIDRHFKTSYFLSAGRMTRRQCVEAIRKTQEFIAIREQMRDPKELYHNQQDAA